MPIWTAGGALDGHYLFGDFVTGRLWSLELPRERTPVESVTSLGRFEVSPSAFTEDPDGGVWLSDFRTERVYRIELATDL